MRVYKRDSDKDWHLVMATRWEELKDIDQLATLMVQQFCNDRAWPVSKKVKFKLVEYKKEEHRKKLCENCIKVALKSKRHGPAVNN